MAANSFKKILRNPQNIIALGVTLISVCALFVSILQTRIMSEQRVLMHEQAKASVWPSVSLGISKAHGTDRKLIDYYLTLSNDGVGPAIISGVKVSYDDDVVQSWRGLFEHFELSDTIKTIISNAQFNHEILKIGESTTVLGLKHNLPLAQAYFEHARHIKFEILFGSIYGDKWIYTIGPKGESTKEVSKDLEFLPEEQFGS